MSLRPAFSQTAPTAADNLNALAGAAERASGLSASSGLCRGGAGAQLAAPEDDLFFVRLLSAAVDPDTSTTSYDWESVAFFGPLGWRTVNGSGGVRAHEANGSPCTIDHVYPAIRLAAGDGVRFFAGRYDKNPSADFGFPEPLPAARVLTDVAVSFNPYGYVDDLRASYVDVWLDNFSNLTNPASFREAVRLQGQAFYFPHTSKFYLVEQFTAREYARVTES